MLLILDILTFLTILSHIFFGNFGLLFRNFLCTIKTFWCREKTFYCYHFLKKEVLLLFPFRKLHYILYVMRIQFENSFFPHSTFISFHTKFTPLLGCEIILCLLTQTSKRDCSFCILILRQNSHVYCLFLDQEFVKAIV